MANLSEHLGKATNDKFTGPQLSFRNWLPGKESVKVSCRLLYLPLGLNYLSWQPSSRGTLDTCPARLCARSQSCAALLGF